MFTADEHLEYTNSPLLLANCMKSVFTISTALGHASEVPTLPKRVISMLKCLPGHRCTAHNYFTVAFH